MKALIVFLMPLAALAQQARPAPPVLPSLVACGVHGPVEAICGTRSPEDLELTPDGKHVLISQFVSRGPGAGIVSFDPVTKMFSPVEITVQAIKGWGDPACPGPIGAALAPHGTSLTKRAVYAQCPWFTIPR